MSDLKAIKKRILREDKLEQIYEAMNCEFIAYRNNRIEAGLPPEWNSTNKRSVQTKLKETLPSYIRNHSDFTGDIFYLISYIVYGKRGEQELRDDLPNAKKFICDTLGWREYLKGGEFEKRVDYVAPLKALANNRRRRREVKPNPVLPESILDQYYPAPSYDWYEEGISLKTQRLFGVSFDLESHRIILPMRNRFGQLVGVKGRILRDEDDDRKYMYLYPYNNSQELFNFHIALPYILMEKKVYVFEGEKSVLKMFEAGVYNCVAIGSSAVTDLQAEMIRQTGMDIDIVLCYDTDKFPPNVLDELKKDRKKLPEEVKNAIILFTGRKVYAIIDMQGLLGPKDAPIDLGIERFRTLERENCYQIEQDLIDELIVQTQKIMIKRGN